MPPEEPFENPGYLGNPKGMRQLMWERGMNQDGMTARALVNTISQLPDFLNEKSVLFTCWTEGGDGTMETTKCHPETVISNCICISPGCMNLTPHSTTYPHELIRTVCVVRGDERISVGMFQI